jgi:hypothetical protein
MNVVDKTLSLNEESMLHGLMGAAFGFVLSALCF